MFCNRKENRQSGKELQRKKRNRKYSSIKKLKRQMDKITSKYKTTIVKKAKAECKRREKEKQTEKEGRGKESWLKMIYLDLDPAV
jgi:hypothetical protein